MLNNRVNRRDFLSTLGGSFAAAGLGSIVLSGCSREGGDNSVRVGHNGLIVQGQTLPVYSGNLDFWLYPPENWPVLLDSLSRLGLNTVNVGVPWGVFETARGEFDFGRTDPGLSCHGGHDLPGSQCFDHGCVPG